jgi:hypothetical protein
MRLRQAAIACALVCAASASANAGEPRAVIELFTSQGCSSCPPADKLLGEISRDSSVIALTMPIDYWDYLGWKDTLASDKNSERQRAYAKARGDGAIYTPQVVVNGMIGVNGADPAAIEEAIKVTDEALRGGRADLCLVGDPRQAIYGWNGADPPVLGQVEHHFPGRPDGRRCL